MRQRVKQITRCRKMYQKKYLLTNPLVTSIDLLVVVG